MIDSLRKIIQRWDYEIEHICGAFNSCHPLRGLDTYAIPILGLMPRLYADARFAGW